MQYSEGINETDGDENPLPLLPIPIKPKGGALEMYGFLNPSKLHVNNDDEDDDDDYDDDFDDEELAEEMSSEEEEDDEIRNDAEYEESSAFGEHDIEYEDNSLDDFDGVMDPEDVGDWRLVKGAADDDDDDGSEEMHDEEQKEIRSRRISILANKKEILISHYLIMMRHWRRLKKHNIFLQDYLYKICVRKNLIKLQDRKSSASASEVKAAKRLKRHRKKVDAKMKANYEMFVNYKPPIVWYPEIKVEHKKTKGMLRRARQVLRPDPRLPKYERKLDKRVVSIHGKNYQRLLRAKSRNWQEVVEQDDAKYAVAEGELKTKALKSHPREEILHGHSEAKKQRTLVKFNNNNGRSKQNLKKDDKLQQDKNKKDDAEGVYRIEMDDQQEMTSCKGKSCHKSFSTDNRTSVSKGRPSHKMSTSKQNARFKKSLGRNSTIYADGKRSVKKVSAYPKGFLVYRKQSKRAIFEQPFQQKNKRYCRKKIKGKKFRELHWFNDQGTLRGRKFSGVKLLSAEKQHFMNFVNNALISSAAKKQAHKLQIKRQAQHIGIDWSDAVTRIQKLIVKKADLETKHKEFMQQRIIDWGLWEKRNVLAVEGLVNLFNTFVQKPYFTKGERRSFIVDSEEFSDSLSVNHANLMEQLLKMYKGRISLTLLQRRLKDKTNQALIKQGYTLSDYEMRYNENFALYQKLQKREVDLESQKQKMAWVMKHVVLTRDLKFFKEKSMAGAYNSQNVMYEDAQTARKQATIAMRKLSRVMTDTKLLQLQAALIEKPHLLNDYNKRKKAMDYLETDKRKLARSLYLSNLELNSIHIKMQNAHLDVQQLKDTKKDNKIRKELNVHKAVLNGRLSRATLEAIHRCNNQPSYPASWRKR